MPFVSIHVTGINEIAGGINDIMRNSSQATRGIIDEAIDLFERTAKSKAHVITGKTKNSIRGQTVTPNQSIVEAQWGAKFEEKRPGSKGSLGPHKFMTESTNIVSAKMPDIIKRHYDQLIRINQNV